MAAAMSKRDLLVTITAGSEKDALVIARAIVEERLGACANIVGPIRSIYRWKDAVQDDREWLLLIKTRAALFSALERRVRELHSYEVPEVIAIRIEAGSKPYLKWVSDATRAPAQRHPAKAITGR